MDDLWKNKSPSLHQYELQLLQNNGSCFVHISLCEWGICFTSLPVQRSATAIV